jgi:CRISPR-associated protein Cas1
MSVLYIDEHGASVGIANERIQVRRNKKIVHEMPVIHLERIILMVPAYITSQAVRYLMERGIDITYMSKNGKFYGQFSRGDGHSVALRIAQYRHFENSAFRLALSKCFVKGKIQNMLVLWKRQRRLLAPGQSLEPLRRIEQNIETAKNLDSLRGFEGSATALHFRFLRATLKGEWKFHRRAHHPSPDPVNAMLSLGYTLLYSNMAGHLQVHGFDPYLGFFHEPKRGHAALASDLIEEWRCMAVDALILWLVNTGQIAPSDFYKKKGACMMHKASLQRFTGTFEKRMQTFRALSNDAEDPVGGLSGQIRQLARVLLGKQKRYIPVQF